MKTIFLPTFLVLLLLFSFSSKAQDFFVEFQNTDYQQTEKLFLENINQYIPQNADGTSERYIESMDPGFFEAWISWIMDEAQIPGASLCFLKDGQMYWKWHNGVANLAQGNPVNDSTVFMACSISKTVIITAIMQLYEEGMFQLDDDVNEYLPFEVKNPLFPDSIITFRYLMTHLSSINDNLELLNSLITYGHDCPIPISSLLEAYLVPGGMYFTDQSYASFPPFQEHNYTNVGATLLAYLVERMTDTDFETYCQNHIFQPLGMEQTSFRLANLDQSRIATPYLQQDGTLIPTDHPGFPVYPSGALRTSAMQLAKLLGMYMQGGTYEGVTILNQNTVDLITTLQYPQVLWPEMMGLIWFFNYGFYKHGGYFPGAQSEYGFSWDR
ncbi:MAG: beta-lactamase family protein, partial [Bacteroidetes bacterium]|nr:beta-lactamase family protein [Bacteroidota bacterium]